MVITITQIWKIYRNINRDRYRNSYRCKYVCAYLTVGRNSCMNQELTYQIYLPTCASYVVMINKIMHMPFGLILFACYQISRRHLELAKNIFLKKGQKENIKKLRQIKVKNSLSLIESFWENLLRDEFYRCMEMDTGTYYGTQLGASTSGFVPTGSVSGNKWDICILQFYGDDDAYFS